MYVTEIQFFKIWVYFSTSWSKGLLSASMLKSIMDTIDYYVYIVAVAKHICILVQIQDCSIFRYINLDMNTIYLNNYVR